MKKLLIFLCILSMFLISCSDVYEETVITDISEYSTIWELSEHRIAEPSALFPQIQNTDSVLDFLCIHQTLFPLGTRWQVQLSMQYDSEVFEAELNRIVQLCNESPVAGETPHFNAAAYASVWNHSECYEYAVVDSENHKITYVYLQFANAENISIEQEFLPLDYKMEMDTEAFSIYE